MNKFFNCLAIVMSIISVAHTQYFQVARNDADLAAAINNRGYTATIIDYMTTTCSRSRYMKVIFNAEVLWFFIGLLKYFH